MTSDTSDVIVALENIVKRFGDLTAVDDLSVQIREGEFFALLGPSGCGKTTTLRMIAGFENPTSGTVRINGREMNDVPPYNRDTGMVFQGYALFPHKTVGENVGFGLKMRDVPEAERKKKVSETLELVNLPGLEDRSTKELSGGQQQRVALARALAIEPSLLLLDEPLSNLDYKLRKELRFELKRIQRETGVTTVYVTHNQEEAMSLSDRILIMNDGQREQLGSPQRIYNRPKNRFIADFIGEANLFSGRVANRDDRTVDVELNGSIEERLTVPVEEAQDGVRPEEAVALNVRPEHIDVTDNGFISGEIVSKTYLGKSTRLLVEVDGKEVQVEVPNTGAFGDEHHFEIGSAVGLTWNPESCAVIPDGGVNE
jgi:spermidine/putrescine transport system ATP-binding protein